MSRQLTATRQERLALLLATGRPIKLAAEEVGVGERTAHTWLDDPSFRALVAGLRTRMLDAAVGRMADLAGAAVTTLGGLLKDDSPTVRLRASLGILDMLIKLHEHVEFDGRLAALERQADDAVTGQQDQVA
jgi:hypothetical protein